MSVHVHLTLSGKAFDYLRRKGGRASLLELHNYFSRLGFSDGELRQALHSLRVEDIVTEQNGVWLITPGGEAA